MDIRIVLNRILVSAILTVFGGCTWFQDAPSEVQWGAGGAVLGAGTGALVGSVISGGEVGPSAAIGGGAGLVAGVLIGYTLDEIEESEREAIRAQLNANQMMIAENQRAIDREYDLHREFSQVGDVNENLAVKVFEGETLLVH
jgi:uncharacterized protein YcfJ